MKDWGDGIKFSGQKIKNFWEEKKGLLLTVDYWVLAYKCGKNTGVWKSLLFNQYRKYLTTQESSLDGQPRGKFLMQSEVFAAS